MAQRMMSQLIEFGEVRRGSLGLSVQNITEQLARAFDVSQKHGVIITAVDPDSPAERAGLKSGDIIVKLNGDKINNQQQFKNFEGLLPLNSAVMIDYLRDKQSLKTATEITENDRNELGGHELHPLLNGATLRNLPAKYRQQYQGVLVDEVKRGSSAWRLGVRAGDLITAVDKQEIATLKQMTVKIHKSKQSPLLNIYRNGRNYMLVLEE
jgi:S1-C subfamily serine protease